MIYTVPCLSPQASSQGVYKKLAQKYHQMTDSLKCANSTFLYEKMLKWKIASTLDMTSTINRMRRRADCNVVILPETFFASGVGIVLPKGALYKKYFDIVWVTFYPAPYSSYRVSHYAASKSKIIMLWPVCITWDIANIKGGLYRSRLRHAMCRRTHCMQNVVISDAT